MNRRITELDSAAQRKIKARFSFLRTIKSGREVLVISIEKKIKGNGGAA
jgi:hypothetical protein